MVSRTKKRKSNSSTRKRARVSYDTRESGNGGSRVINWKEIDGDITFFSPSAGKNAINIIPYEIKSKNHPLVKQGQMEIGDLDYCLDIFVHRNVGPSESAVICLKKTYGKACPICEEAERLKKAGKKDEANSLTAKRRVFYNVEDIRKKPGELQVFDVSHYLFEKELIEEARNDEDGEEDIIDFADPEAGSVVRFRCSTTKQGGFEFNEFKSFSFEEREDPIDDELLEKAISFDEHLNLLTYDQIQEILFGADDDEDEDEEEPSTRKKASAKKAKKEVDEDEDEEDEEEDDEPPVRKSSSKSRKKPSKDDDEDEEDDSDDEDDDEDAPSKKTEKSTVSGKCPNGHKFGKEVDEHKECEDCALWAKCKAAKKEN